MNLIIIFLLFSSFLFMQIYHPMTLLILLLSSSFFMALTSGLLINFWYSYILILIYLGGLLILFTYVITLIPNETMISFPINPLFILPLIFIPFHFSILSDFNMMSPPMNSMKTLYFTSMWPITLFLIIFLLFVLLVVVKITLTKEGPLRLN